MAKSTTSKVRYKPVPDFPGYRVGTDGSVWSCRAKRKLPGAFTGWRSYLSATWKLLTQSPEKHGYLRVWLYRDAKRSMRFVHRLVLEAFVGSCPVGMEACHKNGQPADCRLSNMRWDTRQNNIDDQLRHGTRASGERNGKSKLTAKQVLEIRRLYALKIGWSQPKLARRFKCGTSTIWAVLHITWRHI